MKSKGVKTRLEKPTEIADLNKGSSWTPSLMAGKPALDRLRPPVHGSQLEGLGSVRDYMELFYKSSGVRGIGTQSLLYLRKF